VLKDGLVETILGNHKGACSGKDGYNKAGQYVTHVDRTAATEALRIRVYERAGGEVWRDPVSRVLLNIFNGYCEHTCAFPIKSYPTGPPIRCMKRISWTSFHMNEKDHRGSTGGGSRSKGLMSYDNSEACCPKCHENAEHGDRKSKLKWLKEVA
jgi:hypothetical protein